MNSRVNSFAGSDGRITTMLATISTKNEFNFIIINEMFYIYLFLFLYRCT